MIVEAVDAMNLRIVRTVYHRSIVCETHNNMWSLLRGRSALSSKPVDPARSRPYIFYRGYVSYPEGQDARICYCRRSVRNKTRINNVHCGVLRMLAALFSPETLWSGPVR
jgi:hypothetical protein